MVEDKKAEASVGDDKRRGRATDYTRTDKRPHSFRYKRGSKFELRGAPVALSREDDGAYVINVDAPAEPTGKLAGGTLELVNIKKRANGKAAIAFNHPELGTVVAYDARAARSSLKVSSAKKAPSAG